MKRLTIILTVLIALTIKSSGQIAIASKAIANFGLTDLVIAKPSGLSVGDLMVAVVIQQNTVISSPSGWTRAITKSSNGGVIQIAVDFKIATGADVTASNFTWTNSQVDEITGAIMRITGADTSNPIAAIGDGSVAATSTPSFNTSITPTIDGSLLIYCLGAYRSGGSISASGYAIATDNPTWTEQLDSSANKGGNVFGGAIATAIRPQITPTGNASVTMVNTCLEFSNVMLVVNPAVTTVGIQQVEQNDIVFVFPNPFSNQLTVQLSSNEPTSVSFYGFLGQQVFQESFTSSASLNTEQLAHGIYFYELRNSKGTITNGKVIKQ